MHDNLKGMKGGGSGRDNKAERRKAAGKQDRPAISLRQPLTMLVALLGASQEERQSSERVRAGDCDR